MLVDSSGNLVSDLHVLEVKETCEDFLALDFLDALKQLIQNGEIKGEIILMMMMMMMNIITAEWQANVCHCWKIFLVID